MTRTMQVTLSSCLAGCLWMAGTCSSWSQAQDAAQQADQQPPKWDKSAAVGLTMTRGNSDTLLFTGNALATRKAGANEYNLGADLTYGESDGEKNAESYHAFGQYNRLFTERFFGYARGEGLRDEIAAITYRFLFSPGGGYYFIKATNTTFRGELGPAFIYDRTLGSDGDYHNKGYMTLRLAERYDQKLSDRVKLWEMAEILPQVDDFENYIVNAEIGVDTSLTKKLSLRSYLQDSYHSEPASGREKNDLKIVTAIAYKF